MATDAAIYDVCHDAIDDVCQEAGNLSQIAVAQLSEDQSGNMTSMAIDVATDDVHHEAGDSSTLQSTIVVSAVATDDATDDFCHEGGNLSQITVAQVAHLTEDLSGNMMATVSDDATDAVRDEAGDLSQIAVAENSGINDQVSPVVWTVSRDFAERPFSVEDVMPEIRKAGGKLNWALFDPERDCEICRAGYSAAMEDLKENLDPSKVLFAILRVQFIGLVEPAVKHLFVHWRGQDVELVKCDGLSAKFADVHKTVSEYCPITFQKLIRTRSEFDIPTLLAEFAPPAMDMKSEPCSFYKERTRLTEDRSGNMTSMAIDDATDDVHHEAGDSSTPQIITSVSTVATDDATDDVCHEGGNLSQITVAQVAHLTEDLSGNMTATVSDDATDDVRHEAGNLSRIPVAQVTEDQFGNMTSMAINDATDDVHHEAGDSSNLQIISSVSTVGTDDATDACHEGGNLSQITVAQVAHLTKDPSGNMTSMVGDDATDDVRHEAGNLSQIPVAQVTEDQFGNMASMAIDDATDDVHHKAGDSSTLQIITRFSTMATDDATDVCHEGGNVSLNVAQVAHLTEDQSGNMTATVSDDAEMHMQHITNGGKRFIRKRTCINKLKVARMGCGGVEELAQAIRSDTVSWSILRFEVGSGAFTMVKHIEVICVGEDTPNVHRGRLLSRNPEVQNLLSAKSMTIKINRGDELSTEAVWAQIQERFPGEELSITSVGERKVLYSEACEERPVDTHVLEERCLEAASQLEPDNGPVDNIEELLHSDIETNEDDEDVDVLGFDGVPSSQSTEDDDEPMSEVDYVLTNIFNPQDLLSWAIIEVDLGLE